MVINVLVAIVWGMGMGYALRQGGIYYNQWEFWFLMIAAVAYKEFGSIRGYCSAR